MAQREKHAGLDIEATAGALHALTSFEFYDHLAANLTDGTDPAQVIRKLASCLLPA